MPTLTIPTHPCELTPRWLTAVLRHRETLDRAAVTSISSEVLGTGRGFTGQVLRLHLTYDRLEPTAPRSLIAWLMIFAASLAAARPSSTFVSKTSNCNCFAFRG